MPTMNGNDKNEKVQNWIGNFKKLETRVSTLLRALYDKYELADTDLMLEGVLNLYSSSSVQAGETKAGENGFEYEFILQCADYYTESGTEKRMLFYWTTSKKLLAVKCPRKVFELDRDKLDAKSVVDGIDGMRRYWLDFDEAVGMLETLTEKLETRVARLEKMVAEKVAA